MNKKLLTLIFAILLTACASQEMSQYSYPGYYQPAQYQTAYMSEGSQDALGNYHPPVQKGGQYLPGRWYRAQPGNPGPSPQKVYARENPWSTAMGEVNKMSSDGDVATAPTCRYRSC
jgi:hypothetical protein